MKHSTEPTPVKHGWQAAYDPRTKTGPCTYRTFSISFYRLVPRKNGKGLKKESAGYRLSGPSDQRDAVVRRADEIVAKLDTGWMPTRKTEKFRPELED